MPRTRPAWSAWNYEIARDSAGAVSTATHYWMNKLQGVSDRENYFVTINRPESIAPEKVLNVSPTSTRSSASTRPLPKPNSPA